MRGRLRLSRRLARQPQHPSLRGRYLSNFIVQLASQNESADTVSEGGHATISSVLSQSCDRAYKYLLRFAADLVNQLNTLSSMNTSARFQCLRQCWSSSQRLLLRVRPCRLAIMVLKKVRPWLVHQKSLLSTIEWTASRTGYVQLSLCLAIHHQRRV